jgi:hypothetical protein
MAFSLNFAPPPAVFSSADDFMAESGITAKNLLETRRIEALKDPKGYLDGRQAMEKIAATNAYNNHSAMYKFLIGYKADGTTVEPQSPKLPKSQAKQIADRVAEETYRIWMVQADLVYPMEVIQAGVSAQEKVKAGKVRAGVGMDFK